MADETRAPKRRRGAKRKKPLAEKIEFALFRGARFLLERASSAGIERWSRRIAASVVRLDRRRTGRVLRDIGLTFPELPAERRRELAVASLHGFLRMAFEYIATLRKPSDAPSARAVGREAISAPLAAGRGVILITAHFGPWEHGVPLLGEFGLPVTVVARFLDNRLLDRELFEGRSRGGVQLIDRRGAARSLAESLRRGEIVVLLVDQAVHPRQGIDVPFLGRPAWTTTAPAKLALAHGSAISFAFAYPEEGGVRFELEGPLIPFDLPPEEKSVEAITTKINDVISARIRQRPELWFWQHDRWKRRPAKERDGTRRDSGAEAL
jgi:Kdo2-lipid IVA lauroyltransferase/acyltransferase